MFLMDSGCAWNLGDAAYPAELRALLRQLPVCQPVKTLGQIKMAWGLMKLLVTRAIDCMNVLASGEDATDSKTAVIGTVNALHKLCPQEY
jgi:hypothetical protein